MALICSRNCEHHIQEEFFLAVEGSDYILHTPAASKKMRKVFPWSNASNTFYSHRGELCDVIHPNTCLWQK